MIKMFITFEGLDASGKTSAIQGLKTHLFTNYPNLEFVFTREPGGNNLAVAEKIRDLILDTQNNIDPFSEALLYLTGRNIHIEQVIKPALAAKKVIICDRYIDSSIVYQGHARNLGMAKIEQLNLMVAGNVLPKYTFYFAVEPQTAWKRLQAQASSPDRLEKEGLAFFERVLEGYQYLLQRDKERFIIIDANQSPELVLKAVKANFDKILQQII